MLRSHLGEVRQSGKILWVAKVPHPDVHRRCGLVGLRVAHKEGFQAVFQSKEPVLDVLLHVARPHHGLRVQHEALGPLHLPHVHHTLLHRAAQTFRVRRHIASAASLALSLNPKKIKCKKTESSSRACSSSPPHCNKRKTKNEGKELRPGILVLINDIDWELGGKEECIVENNDVVLFLSTLHGG